MSRFSVLLLLVVALVQAACSSPAASPSRSAPAASLPRVIAVTMTDALRFEPASFSVTPGETVRFDVTNAGVIRHEFFIGDDQAQTDHAAEMAAMGGMRHDEADGIYVDSGQTKSLEHTFATPGRLLVGCHEPGHFGAGMTAIVNVAD